MTESMAANDRTGARAEILQSIRSRLAESSLLNAEMSSPVGPRGTGVPPVTHAQDARATFKQHHQFSSGSAVSGSGTGALSGIHAQDARATFKQRLESVGGHCVAVDSEAQLFPALKEILVELRSRGIETRRIALSDAAILGSVSQDLADEGHEVAVLPSTSDLFQVDVGITTAQGAIAETGTLVLEQALERHRLVSLLPPVHVAILNAKEICATLGEAILRARASCQMSRAITFITGPSRTADIELTLTIGVHGPKELYVIVYEGGR